MSNEAPAAAPWATAQAAMAELALDGLLLSGVAAQEAIGGHRRIAVFQSDPPGPAFVLTREGPPHVCTPDPEGALHLPADHVHPIAFDGGTFARALPTWLGSAAAGRLALDRAAPGAYSMVAAACPAATLVDAKALLERVSGKPRATAEPRAGPSEHATMSTERVSGQPTTTAKSRAEPSEHATMSTVDARRARVRAAADGIEVDTWWCTTPEAIRMISGASGPAASAVIGDRLIADPTLEAALEHLPVRGRVAVDRITVADRDRVLAARPELEIVDAGAIVLAGSTPRSEAELALLREGHRRTEYAIEATRHAVRSLRTERDCTDALTRAGVQLGLEPHIDHVCTVLPRDRASVPWLRGEWAGRAPWRQLTADRELGPGDLLALDAGFFFEGYVTDFGWTFTIASEPTPAEHALARRWTDVADRVTAAIRPGATAADLRAAALVGWEAAEPPWPFGLYVAHGVGFGGVVPPFAGTDLGVAVERTMVLEPGDVLMVEPYIFENGVGGYRAERCVAVTETGADIWTTLPIEQLQPLAFF